MQNQWSIPSQNPDNPATPLAPFRPSTTATGFYTPDAVRKWMNRFGYSYPELQPWNFPGGDTGPAYIASIYSAINNLYGPTRKLFLKHPNAGKGAVTVPHERSGTAAHKDYIVNVRYGKYVIPISHVIV
jgi:hypothetical protein